VAEILDGLPGELLALTAEMPSTRGLLEDRVPQLEVADYDSRSEVEVAKDDALEVLVSES
jgi:hypothetical protein